MANIPVTTVPIRSPSGAVMFNLQFYGAKPKDFQFVPGGAAPIQAALRRRGIDPATVMVSMFDIYEEKDYAPPPGWRRPVYRG